MTYRVVEFNDGFADEIEVDRFDSAYAAAAFMKRVFLERGGEPPPWYLLDPADDVLVAPFDLYEVAA